MVMASVYIFLGCSFAQSGYLKHTVLGTLNNERLRHTVPPSSPGQNKTTHTPNTIPHQYAHFHCALRP